MARKLNYLFLNGELMRVLFISRPRDEIELWSYPSEKRALYTYSDVKRRMEKAFKISEVAKMLNRHPMTIHRAIQSGDIETPQFTYGLSETKTKHQYMMCEKDIIDLHDVLINRQGNNNNQRTDGNISPKRLPNVRELRALIRQEAIFYVKTDEGFTPTWKANQF